MNPKIPCEREALYRKGKPRIYSGRELDEIAFPLGGIGTGCIALGGWGQLRDFEVFNRPAKGLMFDFTFFTLHAKKGDAPPVTRVLQGPVGGGGFVEGGFGISRGTGAGLPHFKQVKFTGAFPFARLDLADPKMPLEVAVEAFNPYIPLNADDSTATRGSSPMRSSARRSPTPCSMPCRRRYPRSRRPPACAPPCPSPTAMRSGPASSNRSPAT